MREALMRFCVGHVKEFTYDRLPSNANAAPKAIYGERCRARSPNTAFTVVMAALSTAALNLYPKVGPVCRGCFGARSLGYTGQWTRTVVTLFKPTSPADCVRGSHSRV